MKKYLYYEKIENENKAKIMIISDNLILGLKDYIEYDGEIEDGKEIYIDLPDKNLTFKEIKDEEKDELKILGQQIGLLKIQLMQLKGAK